MNFYKRTDLGGKNYLEKNLKDTWYTSITLVKG